MYRIIALSYSLTSSRVASKGRFLIIATFEGASGDPIRRGPRLRAKGEGERERPRGPACLFSLCSQAHKAQPFRQCNHQQRRKQRNGSKEERRTNVLLLTIRIAMINRNNKKDDTS